MQRYLKSIAKIQTGYSFRTGPEHSNRDGIAVVQMKDLNSDNIVDFSNLTYIDSRMIKKHHFIKKKDIIFRSRGSVNTAAIVADKPKNMVLAAPLILIRINDKNTLPEFVQWAINQSDIQIFLSSRREGTHGGMINKKTIEEIKIDIPPIEKQRTIVEFSKLLSKEQRLMEKIAFLKKQYYSTKLMQYAKRR